MSALTQADQALIREWVGEAEPSAAVIAATYTVTGGPYRCALSILRKRRADLLARPAKMRLPGQTEVDTTANIKALDALISELESLALAEDPDDDTVGTTVVFTPTHNPRRVPR